MTATGSTYPTAASGAVPPAAVISARARRAGRGGRRVVLGDGVAARAGRVGDGDAVGEEDAPFSVSTAVYQGVGGGTHPSCTSTSVASDAVIDPSSPRPVAVRGDREVRGGGAGTGETVPQRVDRRHHRCRCRGGRRRDEVGDALGTRSADSRLTSSVSDARGRRGSSAITRCAAGAVGALRGQRTGGDGVLPAARGQGCELLPVGSRRREPDDVEQPASAAPVPSTPTTATPRTRASRRVSSVDTGVDGERDVTSDVGRRATVDHRCQVRGPARARSERVRAPWGRRWSRSVRARSPSG